MISLLITATSLPDSSTFCQGRPYGYAPCFALRGSDMICARGFLERSGTIGAKVRGVKRVRHLGGTHALELPHGDALGEISGIIGIHAASQRGFHRYDLHECCLGKCRRHIDHHVTRHR